MLSVYLRTKQLCIHGNVQRGGACVEQNEYKSRPAISVVVPVYNAQDYLEQCLDSILAQTLSNIEIICVDDGSTDDSMRILEAYQKKDERIIVLTQAHMYAGTARNTGMKEASGKYIIFWDADDFFECDCLELLYERAEETQADIVICESNMYDNMRGVCMPWERSVVSAYLPEKQIFSMRDIPDGIFQLSVSWSWDKLFRLEFVKEQKLQYLDIRSAEDENFVFIAMAVAERIALVRKRLVNYRKFNADSLENSKKECWGNTLVMFECFYRELLDRGVLNQVRRSFDNFIVTHMLTVLTMIGDLKAYCDMADALKKKTIWEYRLLEHEPEYYYAPECYRQLQQLAHCSPQEYLVQDLLWRFGSLERTSCAVTAYEELVSKKSWAFPLELVPDSSRIVLYGAGDAGQDIYKQFMQNNRYEVVGWVDINYKKYEEQGLPVSNVENINIWNYDYVIIAILDKTVADKVRGQLQERGVEEQQMIWADLL